MKDLHELSREFGEERIAAVMRLTVRAFRDVRRGHCPTTVDHLHLLKLEFPEFDLIRTVDVLARDRIVKRRAHYLRPAYGRSKKTA